MVERTVEQGAKNPLKRREKADCSSLENEYDKMLLANGKRTKSLLMDMGIEEKRENRGRGKENQRLLASISSSDAKLENRAE